MQHSTINEFETIKADTLNKMQKGEIKKDAHQYIVGVYQKKVFCLQKIKLKNSMKLDKNKLQERFDSNLKKLFSYCIKDYFEMVSEEENNFIILTEELIEWLDEVCVIDGEVAEFLKENNLGQYVYLSYYASPFEEELKEVIKEKISKYGLGNREYLSGFNFFYLDDDSFIDDVASDWDKSSLKDNDIWEFVVIKSILEVLNNKQYENK